jgi:shikimate kinase
MNIYLVGMPGSGKSVLGRLMAVELGLGFLDTDEEITRIKGMSPEEIIDQEGELALRTAEHQLLKELTGRKNLVVSTGGGFPIFHDNMKIMKEKGLTLYLSCSPELLWSRLSNDRRRPLSLSYEVTCRLLEQRRSVYEDAGITVSMGEDLRENLESAVREIRAKYPDELTTG